MMQNRVVYWDIVKALAIILVIFGHSSNLFQHPILMWIYSFHMPLFMVVSGYFFGYSANKRSWIVLRKRLLNTLLPIIIIATVVFVLKFEDGKSFVENVQRFIYIATHHLWFLWALLFDSIIVLAIHKWIRSLWGRIIAALVVCVCFLLTPDYLNQLGAQALFPCFFFGYCMNLFSLPEYYKKHRLPVLISLAVLYALMIPFFTVSSTFYETGIYIFNGVFSPLKMVAVYCYRAFIGIVGSLLFMCIVYEIEQMLQIKCLENGLSEIGKRTMGIYIFNSYLHVLYMHLPGVPPVPEYRMDLCFSIVYLLCMLPISYYLTVLFSKFSKLVVPSLKG